jgi:hypothetical protein
MIDRIPWNYWIYTEPFDSLTNEVQCLALDVDAVDLSEDGFTPSEVAERGYEEFMSVQDLTGVLRSVRSTDSKVPVLSAIEYFLKNDAYPN